MDRGAPDVSVIMAAWSAAEFIAPAIASVLEQTGVSLELIVIDDASPDATVDAARAAAGGDPRIVIEALSENGGPSVARNHGMALARGRYIAVVDCDDSILPGRLAHLVKMADARGADLVADNMNRVSELGARDGPAFLKADVLTDEAQISLADYLSPQTEARLGENLGYLKPLIRRETLGRLKLNYDTTLRNSEDFYLVATLLAQGGKFWLSPQRGYNYLVREGSISHRLTPELTQAILDADRAFMAAFGAQMNADERRAQACRLRQLQRTHAFESVIAALKARQPRALLTALSRQPAAWPHIVGRFASIGVQKLGVSRA